MNNAINKPLQITQSITSIKEETEKMQTPKEQYLPFKPNKMEKEYKMFMAEDRGMDEGADFRESHHLFDDVNSNQ
jgi:hypothetical protein